MRYRRSFKYFFGAVAVVGIIIWIFYTVGSANLTYYYTPSEVLSTPDDFKSKPIRVMGLVEKGSVQWDHKEPRLEFRITDDSKNYLMVDYRGVKPDMFREGQGIVVEGQLIENGHMKANTLLVKHNEEYKTTDHSQSKESYYKTLKY